jgi:hypothetical protein
MSSGRAWIGECGAVKHKCRKNGLPAAANRRNVAIAWSVKASVV